MTNSFIGKIIKGIAGFYYVYVEHIGVVECKAKGAFRNKKVKPLVGDEVTLELLEDEKKLGNIIELLPRENALFRPAVANVSQALVIFAAKDPEPHLNLLDRFLIIMEKYKVPVLIAFNKSDLCSDEYVKHLCEIYERAHYKTFSIEAKNGVGVEELREELRGKTTVLAGPSGVGKSTFMNMIQPEASMETGELSQKIMRGKNTTRHTELVYVEKDTFLLDTPGFSSLFIDEVEAGDLYLYYPEFKEHEQNCRFSGCSHVKEKDCGIKEALNDGLIAKERYDNYCKLYEEAANRKKY